MKRTYKEKFFIPLVTIMSIAACISVVVCDYFISTREIKTECLRLHVIASSDSEEDQAVKLQVRDALLEGGEQIFSGKITAGDALKEISPRIPELCTIADGVLKENGFSYNSSINVVNEYFPAREYDGVTLPAGKYTALKVVLGEGRGKNWWCVMFPPLCLPAVTENRDDTLYAVFGQEGTEILKGGREYRVRFRIVELIEELINKASDN